MRIYEIRLTTLSNILTAFHADSVFGHLCWVIAKTDGETALRRVINSFINREPPFVISDGFPSDLFPKPMTAELLVDDPVTKKELKIAEFVDLERFESFSAGIRPSAIVSQTPFSSHLTVHNTISRLTNSTVEGGLYSVKEISIPRVSIFVKVFSPEWKDRMEELFQLLSKAGYGRKKSIGKGHFKVEEIRDFSFRSDETSTGYVSLSNFCPAENDPTEGFYKTFVKYGKLGDEFTFCGNPFKKPLVMFKAGSVFKTTGSRKEFYGRMIQEGIAPAKPEVVQYAYAFALPIVYPN